MCEVSGGRVGEVVLSEYSDRVTASALGKDGKRSQRRKRVQGRRSLQGPFPPQGQQRRECSSWQHRKATEDRVTPTEPQACP